MADADALALKVRDAIFAQITASLAAETGGERGLAAQVWPDAIRDIPAEQEAQVVVAAMASLSEVIGRLLVALAGIYKTDPATVWRTVALSMQPELGRP